MLVLQCHGHGFTESLRFTRCPQTEKPTTVKSKEDKNGKEFKEPDYNEDKDQPEEKLRSLEGRTMSIGEILGGAAQDSNGAQLKLEQVKDSYYTFFEGKGTDNKIYGFELTSISVRLTIRSASCP